VNPDSELTALSRAQRHALFRARTESGIVDGQSALLAIMAGLTAVCCAKTPAAVCRPLGPAWNQHHTEGKIYRPGKMEIPRRPGLKTAPQIASPRGFLTKQKPRNAKDAANNGLPP